MKKQIFITLVLGLGVIAGLGFVKYLQISKAIAESAKFAPPPDAVTTVVAKEEGWRRTIDTTGQLSPSQGVLVSAELAGKVNEIPFESGSAVKKGDLLVELDASVEEASLKGVVAAADQARKTLLRAEGLRARNANSQSDLETAQALARQAEAQVEELKATIAKKRITAPFSGRLGIRQVNVGQYLSPGTGIVPLHQLDPMFLDFALPEQWVGLVGVGQTVEFKTAAYDGVKFEGIITAINPQVDESTRNIEAQATIPNRDGRLRPGMFADVTVVLPEEDKVIPLPSSSINYMPYGDTVFIVTPTKSPDGKDGFKVRQQAVKLGRRRGDQVAVIQGVKPDDEVVTSGTFKLRPDAPVVVNNSVAPLNDPNPKPADT